MFLCSSPRRFAYWHHFIEWVAEFIVSVICFIGKSVLFPHSWHMENVWFLVLNGNFSLIHLFCMHEGSFGKSRSWIKIDWLLWDQRAFVWIYEIRLIILTCSTNFFVHLFKIWNWLGIVIQIHSLRNNGYIISIQPYRSRSFHPFSSELSRFAQSFIFEIGKIED